MKRGVPVGAHGCANGWMKKDMKEAGGSIQNLQAEELFVSKLSSSRAIAIAIAIGNSVAIACKSPIAVRCGRRKHGEGWRDDDAPADAPDRFVFGAKWRDWDTGMRECENV